MLNLSSISVRSKLALLVAIPLLALLLAASLLVLDGWRTASAMRSTLALTELLTHTSNLALSLQAERGTSAGFLAGGDVAPVRAAREKTDAARQTLNDYVQGSSLPVGLSSALREAEQALAGLAALRAEVDGKAVPPANSFDRYSAWVAASVQLAQTIARDTEQAEVMRSEQSLVALLCLMEQSARERGLLNAVFTADQFTGGSLARVQAALGVQQSCEQQFLALADTATAAEYRQQSQGAAFAETARLRELALAKAAEGGFGVAPKQWFATASERLDGLRAVRDGQLARIRALAQASESSASQVLAWSLGLTAAVLALTIVLAWRIARAIAVPVAQIETLMGRLRDSLDLSLRANIAGKDEVARIGHAFNALVDTLNTTVREVEHCAGAVSSASGSLADTTEQVSAATQSQSDSVNGIAASVEQVTVSIATMAAASHDSELKANDAQQSSARGREIANAAAETMQRVDDTVGVAADTISQLAQRSATIDGIVGTIREIADQTNLLALNAAIEAARAGETGRGFAVVADEVRKLAERAGSATRDISQLVAAIRSDTDAASQAMQESSQRMEQGVGLVHEASAALGQIHAGTAGAMGAAREIAVAMNEQKVASEMVAQQIERIAQMTEQNSRAVFQTAELAQDLNQLSGQLARIVGRFRLA